MKKEMVILAVALSCALSVNVPAVSIKDIDDMVAKYKKTGFSSAELAFYSRLYKRKLFTHYYSRVKHLA